MAESFLKIPICPINPKFCDGNCDWHAAKVRHCRLFDEDLNPVDEEAGAADPDPDFRCSDCIAWEGNYSLDQEKIEDLANKLQEIIDEHK